jgi:hypothetical protein
LIYMVSSVNEYTSVLIKEPSQVCFQLARRLNRKKKLKITRALKL